MASTTATEIKPKRLVGSNVSVNWRVKNPMPLVEANNSAKSTPKRHAIMDSRRDEKKDGNMQGNKI